jgi:hypothetical protein
MKVSRRDTKSAAIRGALRLFRIAAWTFFTCAGAAGAQPLRGFVDALYKTK